VIEPLDGHATHFVKRGIDDHCDDSKHAFKVAALLHAPQRRFKVACRHGHGWWESPACAIVSPIYPIESRLNGQITLVRHARWRTMYTGAPVLDDALATLDCRIANVTRHGTHSVIVADVFNLRLGPASIDASV
jgi:flavin reductase